MKELQIRTCKDHQLTKKEYVLWLITYAFLMAGYLKILFSGFSMLASYWWIYAVVSILLGAVWLILPQGKIGEFLLPGGLVVIMLLFFAGFSFSKNGISVLGNEYLSFLTGTTGEIYLDFPTEGNEGVYYIAALVCGALSLFLTEMLHRKNIIFCYILTALCLLGCAAGLFALDYGIYIMLGGIIFLIFSNGIKISGNKGLASTLITYLGIAAIGAVFALLAVSAVGNKFSTKYIMREVKETIHQAKYDSGTNAMPEGNLRNLGYFRKSDETALTISTAEPQKFYLRGITREIYTGNAWEELSEEAYKDGEDLFYWLHKNGLFGQTTIGSAVKLADNAKPYELEVTNISACKEHQYLPYGLSSIEVLDSAKITDGTVDYQAEVMNYQYYSGSLPQWYEAYMYLSENGNQRDISEYLALEQSYREYVYENDLQLTNTAIGVFERLFGTEKPDRSLSEILTIVKNTLENTLEYKENITTPNGKNDFLKYTMEQSKKGYSVHYATVATLMLRYFGVPARYVEGYFLSAPEAAEYASMEDIVITEAHAHAWTEFYLDGIGWIPFEVTPGYIDDEELKAAEQMVSDGLGEGTGKSYAGSSLKYTPPKQQEEEQHVPDLNSLFRFEVKHILWLLFISLFVLLVVWGYRILKRRKRLLVFFKEMEAAEHGEAITGLFAYSMMLIETCGIEAEDLEDLKAINREALFSNHQMQLSQRQCMIEFSKRIVTVCKSKLNVWEKLRYHYILWLYH